MARSVASASVRLQSVCLTTFIAYSLGSGWRPRGGQQKVNFASECFDDLPVFSVSLDDMIGQLFALLVLTVAAAESAIGLAIYVITLRVRGTIAVEFLNCIQG